jgi:Ca2+-binding EF-hand superfamily protein
MRYALFLPVLLLGFGSSCWANQRDANTREHMISNFRLVLKSWDSDGDGKLSRAEVQTMVNESFRRMKQSVKDGQTHPELEAQRQEFLVFYASQDTNGDGYLTLEELLKGPLASFDCMDANHDGKVSQEEVFSGMERCPSVNLDDYTPKH